MFETLVETRARRPRSAAGMLASLTLHVALIGAAVVATWNVGQAVARPPEPERLDFVMAAPPPPPEVVVPADAVVTPAGAPVRPPQGFQTLAPVFDIPDALPSIDLTAAVTDAARFTPQGVRSGVPGGAPAGVPAGVSGGTGDAPYFAAQVDKRAMQVAGVGLPDYPEVLRAAGVPGIVVVMFVVDTTGRADAGTFRVVESSRREFAGAVRAALGEMRFLPAEIGGRKVKQMVRLPFEFRVRD